MVGKTPPSIITISPLKGGVIADFDATLSMISHYIERVHEVGNVLPVAWARPRVVIGIPSSVTEVERRAVWEAALSAGAREAFLIEEPMAAAIGENISVFAPTGVMVVDIGGGTTEIAIISLGGIVVSKSLKIAGQEMDSAILHYVRLRHGLIMGERTAEDVKIKIGSAFQTNEKSKMRNEKLKGNKEDISHLSSPTSHFNKMAVVRGRDIETGLPKSLRLTEVEIREALAPVLAQILEAISDVLQEAPPELTNDILTHGILLTGGASQLSGLDQLIVEHTRIPVVLSEDPMTSVVRGTGKVLENDELLQRVKVVGGLK